MGTDDTFWVLAGDFLARDGVERSTMMGFPCLRRDGAFFACTHNQRGSLIVKLPKERVLALISDGMGDPFAPNGRIFKEWLEVGTDIEESWAERLQEAWAFAG